MAALDQLADLIAGRRRPHPLRVAIDGPDAAGKTRLADELAELLDQRGRPVIRASIDGFHRPRVARVARGPLSPDGYYHDSFDHRELRDALLEPLGPGGDLHFRRAVFDYRTDTVVDAPTEIAPSDATLLFDGVFLARPELAGCWDLRVFVAVPFTETLRRAEKRDGPAMGGAVEVCRRYQERYIPGQELYFASVHPEETADAVVENADPLQPRVRLGKDRVCQHLLVPSCASPRNDE